jgi:hypothetical protein
VQIQKDMGWVPERLQAPQAASGTAAEDKLQLQLLSRRPTECMQLEAPIILPSCLCPAASSTGSTLLQQCLAGVEVPDASANPVPQLMATFDCCAEAQPIRAPEHAGNAAAEQAALLTWICSKPADVWHPCEAAEDAMLEVPCFMPLTVATAAVRNHGVQAALSAANAEFAQLLGDISSQVWL